MHRRKAVDASLQATNQEETQQADNRDAFLKKDKKPYLKSNKLRFLCLASVVLSMLLLATGVLQESNQNGSLNSVRRNERLTAVKNSKSTGLGSNVEYHIVVSTGCTLYQDWQSYMFFYHAMASGQPGTVTRIASGCKPEEEAQLRKLFHEQIYPMAPGRFQIHFTPDYAHLKPKRYVYFNKPYGMRHWMENVLGFPDKPENEDAIIILMDPDQIIMRPFTNNDFSNTEWKYLKKGQKPRTRIEHGAPMGQLYGFGLQWFDKVNRTHVFPDGPTPVDELTREEARAGFVLGPPYIATARDMYNIVCTWSDIVVRVHDAFPFLLAEMYAYSLAAAYLKLPHQTADSFMLSNAAGSGRGEGWSYIDKMSEQSVCGKHTVESLPNVMHYCHAYGLGQFLFGKQQLPRNFLSCETPLLVEPPEDLAIKHNVTNFPGGKRKEWDELHAKRQAFATCYLIPAINGAAEYFKRHHCNESTAIFRKMRLLTKKTL